MAFHFTWAFAFGILGNLVSFGVSLAPLPTFYQIYKKKTSEGFQSIPYVVSLFSAMLWIYYALLKKDAILLITINTFCVFIQTFYIFTYFYYAPKKERIVTVKLILLFNVFGFGVVCLTTLFLEERLRLCVLGYICMGFALSVFVAPLCIVRKVIKTKSVEFMPFYLSLFLTLGAVMWFFYGLLLKDLNIAIPNILGFIFGIIQMILYAIYRKKPKKVVEETKIAEHIVDVVKLSAMASSELSTRVPRPTTTIDDVNGEIVEAQKVKKDETNNTEETNKQNRNEEAQKVTKEESNTEETNKLSMEGSNQV